MKFLVALVLLFALAECLRMNPHQEFSQFMKTYNKRYNGNEISKRFQIFTENKAKIQSLNQQAEAAGRPTKYAINKFADWSEEEFKTLLGYKSSNKISASVFQSTGPVSLPDSLDWRTKGVVTAVKDQGQCGSCWAFSATEGVESAWKLCGHGLPTLAPQQIVDCDTVDQGCDGGDLPTAFQYLQQNGQEPEKDYPYTAEDGTCAYKSGEVVARITGFQYATQNKNETQMQEAMVTHGPLSVCVDASEWQFYSGGVLNSCTDSLDHCVQIVGWNTDSSSSLPYWIVRNSWGTDWGLNGYIWIERNQDMCGIAEEATYVTCKK